MTGDTPLVEAENLLAMVAAHRDAGAAATLLTFDRTETIGGDFGRIVRGSGGAVEAIVELRDADDAQRALHEVNGGDYAGPRDRRGVAGARGPRPKQPRGAVPDPKA